MKLSVAAALLVVLSSVASAVGVDVDLPSWSSRSAAAPAAPSDRAVPRCPGYPTEMVSAGRPIASRGRRASTGRRNVYTASGAAVRMRVRLTNVTKDDGVELSDISISDDGATCRVRARHAAESRRLGRESDRRIPRAPTRTIWAARTAGGARVEARRRHDAGAVAGRTHGRVREGRADLSLSCAQAERGEPGRTHVEALRRDSRHRSIKAWGTNANAEMVARRIEARLRQQPRRPFADRRLRRAHARPVTFLVAERRSRHAARRGRPTASASPSSAGRARRSASRRTRDTGSIGNPDGPAYNPLTAMSRPGAAVGGGGGAQAAASGGDRHAIRVRV